MAAGVDEDLVASVRDGCAEAYGELYARHIAVARTAARHVSPSAADAEDLVAEAFARILSLIRRGGGPVTAFRPYVLTTIRNLAAAAGVRRRRLVLAPAIDEERNPQLWESFDDPALAEFERSAMAVAFAVLPPRWRRVLWCIEVEGMPLPDVARRFGISRNTAAALAYRARKGLRQAYADAERDHAGPGRSDASRAA